MNDRGAGDITVQVIQTSPEEILVQLANYLPDRALAETLLRKATDTWLHQHPRVEVERVERADVAGTRQGFRLFLHDAGERQPMLFPSLAFVVNAQITNSFSKEYIEAVIADAKRIFLDHEHNPQPLLVINRRDVALIYDSRTYRCFVAQGQEIRSELPADWSVQYDVWQRSKTTSFYATHIPEGWFRYPTQNQMQ